MDPLAERLTLYRELADRYDQLGQVSMRDRFLMLAADVARQGGQPAEAERLRDRLLHGSRHHMLRPYHSFAEAAQAPDVQTYLHDLHANYPVETAKQLLDSLRPGDGPPVEQTQPMDWGSPVPSSSAIPPTAPLLDVHAPRGSFDRPTWAPVVLTPEVEPAAPPGRPLAQPLPGRIPPSRPAPPADGADREVPLAAATAARPAAAGPIPVVLPYPLQPEAEPPVAAPLPRHRPEPLDPLPLPPHPAEDPVGTGSWLILLLFAVVAVAGAGLTLFTLARPFLPADWLP